VQPVSGQLMDSQQIKRNMSPQHTRGRQNTTNESRYKSPHNRSRQYGNTVTEPNFDISPVRNPADLNEIDVVCCICDELIPFAQVDAHSRMCEYKRVQE